jgi:predicted Zn finger-like uncharacterized protein
MKSTCPHCGTTYRIDPRKVPAGGVNARCSRCGGVFAIAVPEAAGAVTGDAYSGAVAAPPSQPPPPPVAEPRYGFQAPAQSYAGPPTPSQGFEDSEGQVDLPTLGASPRMAPPPGPPPPPVAAAPAPAPPSPPPTAPVPEPVRERPAPTPPAPPPLFGRPDPHGKARRLARALISDIAVYNPERRDRGLADGTLRQEFREEIKKSWEEYVAQVGDSIARSTPYFREALNEILAGGRAVF